MLGHDHQADERELIVRTDFVEDFDEEIARSDGSEEREAAVATARDEVKLALTVSSSSF
jgi:hypothetical protein